MKIHGNKPPEGPDAYLKAQRMERPAESQGGQTARAGIQDRVNLSGKAQEIAELKQVIKGLPDIRTEKVKEIHQAVANGTYKVDSMKIAGKMIDEIV